MAVDRPKNYENTPTGGNQPPDLGGHRLVIKQVSEMKSKAGRDMIVVLFDFADDDRQPGHFTVQFKDDVRPDKKWPNQATQYILIEDSEGKCSRSFKTFTTCVEHSNPGFTIQWGERFCQCLKGKKVGGVFGEQMDYYEAQGREIKKRVLRWFCSLDKVADADIPGLSETKAYKEHKQGGGMSGSGTPDRDGFMDIPDGIDEELPFN